MERRMRTPQPDAAFRWSREPWGDALRCRRLEPWAQHLYTTRQPPLRADAEGDGWDRVSASLGGERHHLLRIKQVHGRAVRVVRAADFTARDAHVQPEADAIVSDAPGAILAVQVADCVPMLMVDSRTGVAAAVHAGWRGTCAWIGAAAVAALTREFGSSPADLRVAFGPSIGACCYEVGGELLDAFRRSGAGDRQLARWFTRTATGSLRLDLWAANRDQLAGAGVPRDQIFLSHLCTETNADVFDSYRAAGPGAGRMIAAIAVPLR
jgi:YfiH family protein